MKLYKMHKKVLKLCAQCLLKYIEILANASILNYRLGATQNFEGGIIWKL